MCLSSSVLVAFCSLALKSPPRNIGPSVLNLVNNFLSLHIVVFFLIVVVMLVGHMHLLL